MAYLTQADLVPGLMDEQTLIQLTDDDGAGVVDDDVVDAAIQVSETEVDGYLGARFALPLATVPALVTSVTARVCRYKLHARRPGALSDDIRGDYKAAIRLLENISKGVVTLGVQPQAAANEERLVHSTSEARVYGRDNLKDF